MSKCMLSPVLADMLAAESSSDIYSVEISDAGMLKEFFAQKLTQSLLKKQRLLVVIPDKMSVSVPSKILSNYNLAHYSCAFQNNDVTDVLLSERVRLLASLSEIPLLRQEYGHIQLKFKDIANKVHETLLLINKAGIKNPSFKQMLLSTKEKPKSELPESVVESIASVNINPTVLDQIASLQSMYQPHFFYMQHSSRLTNACLEDHEAYHFAIEEMSSIQKAMYKNVMAIEKELYQMKKIISFEVEEELAKWSKIKEELQEAFLDYELENMPSSFEEKGFPIVQKLKGWKYLKINLEIIAEKGWGQVSKLLSVMDAVMEAAPTSINTYFEEYVRKLSPFHTMNETLDEQVSEAFKLLQAVNSSKYIEFHCKPQFLQLDALINGIKETYQQILICKNALSDSEFMRFKRLLYDINVESEVIQCLLSLENGSWQDIIEYYGLQSHLNANYSTQMCRLEDWYRDLNSCYLNLKHVENKELHNRWCSQRQQSLTNIKNTNWEMYQDLFQKEKKDFSFQYLMSKLGNDLQNFFPIMIAHESDIKYVMTHPCLEFDEALFLDLKDISITDVSLMQDKRVNTTIASTYNLDVEDLMNQFGVIKSYCSDPRVEQSKILESLEQSRRYRYALDLSGLIANQIDSANIYKIHGTTIISCVDEKLDKKIREKMNVSAANILHTATKDISNFVETLLHYDDLILIIENNLLNDHHGFSILWQQSIVELIRDSGIKVCNMNTYELYQDAQSALEDLIKEINPARIVEPKEELDTLHQ